MIFYIPCADKLVILLRVNYESHLLSQDAHEIGSMDAGLAQRWGWKFVGYL